MGIPENIKSLIDGLKSDPKRMMVAISAVTVIALSAYLIFALKPQIVNVVKARVKIGKAAGDLKAAQSDIAKIGVMRSEVDAYGKKMSEYEKALPPEDRIPALLESLSEMARSSDMRIAGIVPTAVKDDAVATRAYREITVNITAKAGYHELGRFISRIENDTRFMKITDIQIKGDKALPRMHSVDLKVAAYVLPEGK